MKRIKQFLITTIIGGLIVILPLAILVLVVKFLFNFIVDGVYPLVKLLNLEFFKDETLSRILAFLLMVAFCFIVGLLVRTRAGKAIINSIERELLHRIPFYTTIKDTVQQFTGGNKMAFMKVVLADIYGTDARMTGFVTDETDDHVTVFVPTGPNPTNGFIFHLHESKVTYIDIPPEEAMKTIISLGAGSNKLLTDYFKKNS